MIALDEGRRRRIASSARLLDSDKAGEAAAALAAIKRLLPAGASLGDLVGAVLAPPATVLRPNFDIVRSAQPAPAPLIRSWQKKAMDVIAHSRRLNDVERRFAQSMLAARSEPSEKQSAWLDDLVARVRRAA